MRNFAIIGVAGYIAIRHVKAIKDTGNNLVAALDKFDSVGFLDSYFPDTDFFVEFERFDRHIEKLKRIGTHLDYVSICSPNYLHDSHIRFALRIGADAICEKPVVLNPWNIEALQEIENETGKKIHNVLQLRLHPAIIELKNKIATGPKDKIYDIDLTYIASRGNWYMFSWKGDEHKSGGIATNIGVHFFDMLTWIFGDVKENRVHILKPDTAAGFLFLERARVRWFLSIDNNVLPEECKMANKRTYRSIRIDGDTFEFSEGFTDLHTETYREIIKGTSFGIEQTKKSIQTVYDIRVSEPVGKKGEYHPFCNKIF
ncbi:MAG: Gfo/Idh/MocA family oxidoreductase [Bacteroidia bacterium]|nr:Gfo/Idh/MocA family oxidoreductase [Bacteroidia bacterium]